MMIGGTTLKSVWFVFLITLLLALPVSGSAGDDARENMDEMELITKDITRAVGNLEILENTLVQANVTLNLGELTVHGIVDGNVKNNMGKVTVNGDVKGDVETNMGQVVVYGNVTGNVITNMGDVTVDGAVGGDVVTDLGTTRIEGTVGGNARSGAGELHLSGIVAGNIDSAAGNLYINGLVEGDVNLDYGVVEMGPDAAVSGRVYVRRGTVEMADTAVAGSIEVEREMSREQLRDQDAVDPRDVRVNGNIGQRIAAMIISTVRDVSRGFGFSIFPGLSDVTEGPFRPFLLFYGSVARTIWNMIVLFALAALTHALFPDRVKMSAEALSSKTGPVIGWGLLATVLAVPLMILLAISIIGIPLILVEIIFLAVAALLGYTAITQLLGTRMISSAASRPVHPFAALALGVFIISLLSMVPVIGSLVSLAVFVIAVGSALVSRFGFSRG